MHRLAALENRAAALETSPGWIARESPIFWNEPRSPFVPTHWDYAKIREALEEASAVVDLSLAERRILALRNPHSGNNFATTRTLSLAYQFMLPGEIASTHRHASHALRVMIDARGTYSVVDGVRMPMETGDIVLTPGGSWHGHGHDGDAAACWVDALDIPLTHLLEPMFFEPYPGKYMQSTSRAEISPFRFTAAGIAAALDATQPSSQGIGGRQIELPAPQIATMALRILRLAHGDTTRAQRSTASRAVVAMAGSGRTRIGEATFDWRCGDTIAIPAWAWYEHEAIEDAQLFEVSDEPVLRACNYWRHELR